MRFFRHITIFFVILFAVNHIFAQDIFKNDKQRQAIFRLILPDNAREVYDEIYDNKEKNQFEMKYWKLVDPTPNAEKNEFYEEFLSRVEYAQKHYSSLVAPLFVDDRGKYYIKYGPPDDRVFSSGVGKPYDDNETWAYYDYNLFVDFVHQIGFGYREVNNLLDAVTAGPLNEKVFRAAELYTERESLHQKYLGFRDILNGKEGLRSESAFHRLIDGLRTEKQIIKETAPPARFTFSYNKVALDARLDACVFRSKLGFSRVEFYYSFAMNQLSFKAGSHVPFESLVERQLTIFNDKFQKIIDKTETLKLVANSKQQIQKRIYLNQHTEELMPGNYYVILRLDNIGGNRLAILRSHLTVPDFSGDSLMLSQIQFSSLIREGMKNFRNLKPNNIQVVPYLGNQFHKDKPIYIYFEIYNLKKDETGRTRFKVDYKIKSMTEYSESVLASAIQFVSHLIGKKKKETVGSSFENEGQDEFQQIYLSIDFSKVATGATSLQIEVTDLNSGQNAKQLRRFILK
ncbi:MAG: GWxTD domain-containing protein [Calditrichaeota bacterium]|nr:GWxTD domain-containing protein [Calditrichota bacterium]